MRNVQMKLYGNSDCTENYHSTSRVLGSVSGSDLIFIVVAVLFVIVYSWSQIGLY